MSANSVIEHRANYYYLKLREEYLVLCKGNHCQALILDVLEEWTNSKREKKQSLYIYMTYPQWVAALYGMYGRNTIIEALSALEKAGFLSKRSFRIHGKDTFEYLLNVEKINAQIRDLAPKSSEETLPNLNAFENKRVQKQTRLKKDAKTSIPVYFQTGDAFKNKPNIESNTQNSNNTEHNNGVACATDTSPDFSDEKEPENQEEPPSKKKPARKPRAPKTTIDAEMMARIEAVFTCLDGLARETSGDPEFSFSRTKKATEDIRVLITGRTVSPTNLRLVYLEMWNAPAGKDGFSWKENMSIAAICRNYDQKLLAAKTKLKSKPVQESNKQEITAPTEADFHAPIDWGRLGVSSR